MNDMNGKENDFYQKLRIRIKVWSEKKETGSYRWAKWLLLAPDLFHLLIRLIADPSVALREKAKLGAVVAYFISPLDLLPELILGPTGFLDDIVLTAYALNSMINRIDPVLIRKHWAGEGDVLVTLQNVVNMADQMIGSGLFRKLRRVVK
jgi:uncharacterized membrane protein YkvA (DUF1232 family)